MDGLKNCIEIQSCFRYGKTTLEFLKSQNLKSTSQELTDSQKIVREGDRKHMYILSARKFS